MSSNDPPQPPHWTTDPVLRARYELFLTDWASQVGPSLTRGTAAQGYSVSYGVMGLQAAFVLNGGVLGALPATINTITTAPKADIAHAATWFVFGILAAGLATLFAYLNYEWHAQYHQYEARDTARRLFSNYALAAREENVQGKLRTYELLINCSQWAAVLSAVASYALFVCGVFQFIALVYQFPTK